MSVVFQLATRRKLDGLMNNARSCYYFAKSKRKKIVVELDLQAA